MANTIREYEGLIKINDLTTQKVDQILKLFVSKELEYDLYESQLEVQYTGRDFNRSFEKILIELAQIIIDATGEITCQIDDDENGLSFEYYTINNGRLFCQEGKIQRGAARIVE
ncbi:hypothetical protein [Sulfidibacter corallicola]|uniref:Uncharacterized protein n=1 Tax=Sulfidibacter corallicola TaxID=2818388 RepID=A0A8A4TIG8_SULCO|nr:hypothetical protein [Sulfidibacter corallicola]QTD49413.1 hypothetical protein J3U87_27830 [Sulfidibacter corallicola]